jgi:universal stress protein A
MTGHRGGWGDAGADRAILPGITHSATPKGAEMKGIRRILCASDFSTASRPAVKKAIEIARSTRARLLIVHAVAPIVPPLMGEGAFVAPATWEAMQREARQAAQRQIDRLVQTAKKAGVAAEGRVVDGVPADQIVRLARVRQADMVVIGTHGRTGFSRLLLGSVAGRVVATARCPVLTVRSPR